jgi:hypothetical protein
VEMGSGGPVPPEGGPYGGQPQQGAGPYGANPGTGPGAGGYVPPPPPGAYQQPQYQQGGGGHGAGEIAQTVQRAVRTPETKPFFLTSEFVVWALTVIALLIAGAVTKAGTDGSDVFSASTVWTLVTVIGFAYIISRGISKAGQKYRDRGNPGGGGSW